MKDQEFGSPESLEELITAYRSLEDFVHMVSHDLQSPLKKISNFAGLARMSGGDALPDQTKHYLERIEASARKASDLVTGLLEFSKQSTSTIPPEQTNVNDVISDVLSELEFQIEKARARIVVDHLPSVFARRNQLYYVFANLIENAINYKSTRPLEIKISSMLKDHERVFSVSDNGIGIDPSDFNNIFQLFRRLDHVHGVPGHGIGLSICKKIVEKHGGRIWVQSKPGAGTTFSFSLPASSDQSGQSDR